MTARSQIAVRAYIVAQRDYAKDRRSANAADGACINENKDGTHGKATHGVRCRRCHLVHRFGAAEAKELPEWHAA